MTSALPAEEDLALEDATVDEAEAPAAQEPAVAEEEAADSAEEAAPAEESAVDMSADLATEAVVSEEPPAEDNSEMGAVFSAQGSEPGITTQAVAGPAANITITSKNVPDATFRNFIISQLGSVFDPHGIYRIDIFKMGISNLKGIELFPDLEILDCSGNKLKSIDLSKNTKLTALNVRQNKLTRLDVSKNRAMEYLAFDGNPIPYINLANCKNLIDYTGSTTLSFVGSKEGKDANVQLKALMDTSANLKKVVFSTKGLSKYNASYKKSTGKIRFKGMRNRLTGGELYYSYKTGAPDGSQLYVKIKVTKFKAFSPSKLTMNKKKVTLARKGKTVKLKASITPFYADKKGIKWSSSKKGVAKVSKSGKVTAVKKGKATITAKTVSKKRKATCKVIVKK